MSMFPSRQVGDQMLQRIIVLYDIPDDRIRVKVADMCMDYGLDRVQFSAFVGQLQRTHQEELMLRVKERLGSEPGNVQLIPISSREWKARIEVAHD